jgi:hypothetical protein
MFAKTQEHFDKSFYCGQGGYHRLNAAWAVPLKLSAYDIEKPPSGWDDVIPLDHPAFSTTGPNIGYYKVPVSPWTKFSLARKFSVEFLGGSSCLDVEPIFRTESPIGLPYLRGRRILV